MWMILVHCLSKSNFEHRVLSQRMAGTASLKVVTVIKACEDGAPSTIAPPLKASANESLVVLDRAVVNGAPHYWAINRRGLFGVIPVAAVRVAGSGAF